MIILLFMYFSELILFYIDESVIDSTFLMASSKKRSYIFPSFDHNIHNISTFYVNHVCKIDFKTFKKPHQPNIFYIPVCGIQSCYTINIIVPIFGV